MATASDVESYVMVAAIDFGTTFSGYAFSFKNSKEDIKINKNWGEVLGFQSTKTPTTVLTDGRGQFIAFGYDAEKKFTEADDEHDDDDEEVEVAVEKNLYRHFKMVLHKKEKLTTKTVVCSTSGQITPAIDIFTHALRYLKEHLLNEVSKSVASPPSLDMIRWVITVPAIWSEESKQFMRETAFRSGCIQTKDSKQLVIALEPEAASFFCRQLHLANFEDAKHVSFPSGTQYLVLDCGGGTNDMVVHEVVLDYKVKELFAVTGGSHGGTNIDDRFIQLLKDTLGDNFINTFQSDNPEQWFLFLSKFERAKKAAIPDGKSKLNIEVPFSMAETFAVVNPGKTLAKHLKGLKSKGVNFINGMLVLSHEVVRGLFADTVQDIIRGVKQVFQHPKIRHLDYIFMVGGFSESAFIQQAMEEAFGGNGCKVLIPSEAQLAIIKGAVLYGYHQDHITSRIARKTYGVAVSKRFDPSIHDHVQKYTDADGNVRCRNILNPLIIKDEEIATGSQKVKTFPVLSDRVQPTVDLYSLPRTIVVYSLPRKPNNVEYTDGPDVTHIGAFAVNAPSDPSGITRTLTLTFTFGSTEILVEATASTSSEVVTTTIDFLSD